MTRLLAAVLLALAISGCMNRSDPGPVTPTSSVTPQANFLGNWSLAQGNFTLVVVRTTIAAFEGQTNASMPRNEPCTVPFTYQLDRANRTFSASRHYALHPYDPGNLTVVFVHDLVWNERCIRRGFYGVNENAGSPDICLYGLDPNTAERLPWNCHLPVEPINDVGAAVWVNVSFPIEDGAHRSIVNGREFGPHDNGSFTFWTEDPGANRRYRTDVQYESIGPWPYSAVRRP